MIVPGPIARKHELVRPYVREVEKRVKSIVLSLCERGAFAFVGRPKETSSLAEKIESGRYGSWGQLDDLYACSVVIPTLDGENEVLEKLAGYFEQVELRARGSTQKDPQVFRFDASRFIGRLRADEQLDTDSPLRKVLFEVQVRTAFEHAWSVTTHSLAYKGNTVDWKHLRLTAQLKASVEQLDGLVAGFEKLAAGLSEQHWPEVAAKHRIETVFEALFGEGILPAEARPASWVRFCDNLFAFIRATSRVVRVKWQDRIQPALDALAQESRRLGNDNYPRSLSLMQFCVGVLARAGLVPARPDDYMPLLTQDLTDLFPETAVLGQGFDLEFATEPPPE